MDGRRLLGVLVAGSHVDARLHPTGTYRGNQRCMVTLVLVCVGGGKAGHARFEGIGAAHVAGEYHRIA